MELDRAFTYVDDVLSGKVLAGKYIKQVCKRFREDLDKKGDDWNYYFSPETAEEVVTVVQTFRYFEGPLAGEKVHLPDWQVFFVANVYGWLRKGDNQRRYRRALLYVARHNTKTFLTALLALYELATVPNGLAVSVATTTEQAEQVLTYMKKLVGAVDGDPDVMNEDGSPIFEVYDSAIYCRNRSSSYCTKSSIVRKLQGFHPTLLIADEIASYPDTYRIIDVIESGMKQPSPRPLTIFTTTGDQNTQSIGYIEFEKAKKILSGRFPDDSYFALLYCIDEGDKWDNIEVIGKANPNLNISVSYDEIQQALNDIKLYRDPVQEIEYKVKTANTFIAGVKGGFPEKLIQAAVSNSNKRKFKEYLTEEYLTTCPCAGGIDLSKRFDFTAYTLYWYIAELDMYYARHHFYIPEEQISVKMKTDSPVIRQWVTDGYIRATPGKTVDYHYLKKDLEVDFNTYDIREIGYDQRYSADLISTLQDKYPDLPIALTSISNSHQKQHEALGAWEELLVNERLIDGNPVWAWMASNATIVSNHGLRLIDKIGDTEAQKSTKRIDGVDTSIMAYSCILGHLGGAGTELEYTADDFLFL
jgi:phage terminase large subunit-like protein